MIREKLSLPKTIQSLGKILLGRPKIPPSLKENPMLRIILERRSVRSFAAIEIEDDKFTAILEAGRLAPCTVNLQSWTFAAFDAEKWRSTFGQSIPFSASRAVVIISDSYRFRQVISDFPFCPLTEYSIGVINASLAAMNMNLAAEAMGISSVMLSETGRSGILDARFLKEKLELPDGAVPLLTIVFGYARGVRPPMPPKLPLNQISIESTYQTSNPAVMQSWLEQMIAGYNASHPGSSFKKQLQLYESKIEQAEKDLTGLVYYKGK